ncbi:IS30 family transposase [Tomitella fengzijianii]|uniref:IS30 family transposase n=1 Tax=Tomitella fengzijianii TaxID=2597660 RepID=UPI00131DA6AE|nr:IS30 family transposase [Tomitella fengzijianii]
MLTKLLVPIYLRRSRTPRQIAGRLHREATGDSVDTMVHSPDAAGRTVSHEAIYRWIYALPKGELAKSGILLRSKRTRRKPRKALSERAGAKIVGMVSIDDRPEQATGRRIPGSWEGDLIIGKGGKSAAATLVERTSRFTLICGLPAGKNADGLADVLIDTVSDMPRNILGSLTSDKGTEMARHAALTTATDLKVYFAHPPSPWERGTNETPPSTSCREVPPPTTSPT